MAKIEMEIDNTTYEVHFDYEPYSEGSRDEPPSGGYATIYEVLHKGESVYEVIASSLIEKWELEVYDSEYEYRNTKPED